MPPGNPKRRPHVPTSESRRTVAVLAGTGTPHEIIAQCIGIEHRSLRKHYPDELAKGKEIATAAVVETLFRMAASGRHPAATFFWLKTQCSWREVDRVEHDHTHRGQIAHVPLPLSRLSQETLDMVEADLARALPDEICKPE